MNRLIAICVANPIFVNILLVLIFISGGFAAVNMIRETLPEFSVDVILVQVPYLGAGPEEVEEGIALKLEDAIEGIEGIKRYHTVAAENMGSAVIEVDESADLRKVKDDIINRIDAIMTFPEDAEEPVVSELTTRRQVMFIALYGEVPEAQLKELAEDIKDDLVRLPAISQVSISGARRYEISIEVPEAKLRQYGLTLDQVSAAVRRSSQNWSAGSVRTSTEQIKIRTLGRRYTGEDYADIVLLARPDGTSLKLGQIAHVRDDFEQEDLVGRFNNAPSVTIQIYKTLDEDSLKIARQVETYVELKNQELPGGVRLKIWADNSRFITERIELLLRNGRIGLTLVFLLLWLFLDLRLAFWVTMGIPISLAGALALMGISGQTINMISLFALIMILGIIVDDAIVVGEAIYVRRRAGSSPLKAAIEGGGEVAWPVFAAVITSIIAFSPLLMVKGIMGKFIHVLPVAVISALVISLVESLLMLPTHLRHLPPLHHLAPGAAPWRRKIHRLRTFFNMGLERMVDRFYKPLIGRLLPWRYVTLAAAIAILLITVGLVRGGFLKYQMFPTIDTDFLIARVEFPDGTPIDVTKRAIDRMEAALREVAGELKTQSGEPLVGSVYSVSGLHRDFKEELGAHLGEIFVELLHAEKRGIYYREIVTRWERAVGPIPGALAVSFSTPTHGPPGGAIEVWLMGRDLAQLRLAADDLKSHLGTFDGVFQIEDDFRPGKRELRLRLKPQARHLNLTVADLGRQLRQGFYGDESLRIQRGRDEVKVWVRYPLEERRSLSDVDKIRIRTPEGLEIPLGSVADIEIEQGFASIQRTGGQRRITVTADVDNQRANATEITGSLSAGFLKELVVRHPGVHASLEGEKRENAESMTSLAVGFPLSILGIFLVLATMFRSYVQPLVIMATIPFGLVGAFIGHMVMGFDLTMLSMFGLVALTGIVVNDSIILIECVNGRLAEGGAIGWALREGGARRFRAIVLTTLTTSFGLAPLILEKSMQAQFLIPMAISIAFGVAFASVLTLILVPCLLLILNDLRRIAAFLWTGHWPQAEAVEPATIRAKGNGEVAEEIHLEQP